MKLKILHRARIELRGIANKHKMLVGANSARKITNTILDSLDLLKGNPHMGKKCEGFPFTNENYRCMICGNYLCFYKVIDDCVIVYHIVDGRTDYTQLFY